MDDVSGAADPADQTSGKVRRPTSYVEHPPSNIERKPMPTVGLLTLEIYVPGLTSLKEKRGVVKPLVARIRREFNVSVAEVDDQDQLGHTVLAVAAVSVSGDYVYGLLERIAQRVAAWRLDAELVDYTIELL